MKEIKWALYTAYVIFYTSLAWFIFVGLSPKADQGFPILLIPLVLLTAVNLAFIIKYLAENWDK